MGSTGSGGRGEAHKTQPVYTNGYPDLPGLTLDISGYGTCNADGHTSTQPTFSSKYGYLSVKKVKEIEYWLAEVDSEGDDGSLEIYVVCHSNCYANLLKSLGQRRFSIDCEHLSDFGS